MPLSRVLSDPLLQAICDVSGIPKEGSVPSRTVVEGVLALSERFTRGGNGTPSAYLEDTQLRAAYLQYYFPVNLAKVQTLLDEVGRDLISTDRDRETFRVLDIGSGPGTGVMAVVDWFSRRQPSSLHCVAVDRSKTALALCEQLWQGLVPRLSGINARLVTEPVDLERVQGMRVLPLTWQDQPFDLIIMANCLSELFVRDAAATERRVGLVKQLLDLLDRCGTFILVEPASRFAARALHFVRDRVLKEGRWTVYSPCLHEQPCPALVKEQDWCHEERPWQPPTIVNLVDREVGFIKDALKFSYLILRKDGKTLVPREPGLYRIVSELRVMKGEKRAWLCHEGGRPEVGRLDRERSAANAAVDDWHRGAIVRIDEIVRGRRRGREATVGRIPSSASVDMVRSI